MIQNIKVISGRQNYNLRVSSTKTYMLFKWLGIKIQSPSIKKEKEKEGENPFLVENISA